MSEKILLVDDDKEVTEGIGAFLKTIGHDMLLATNGREALEIIRRENPVLVLLDIQMPGINGIQILETLRRKFKNTKVFIITAYARDVKWKCDVYDFNIDFADIDKFAEYIMSTSFRPKRIIMHGILPRLPFDIAKLERKGIVYCSQNVLTDEQLRRMNKRLIDTVARECIKLNLVKEKD